MSKINIAELKNKIGTLNPKEIYAWPLLFQAGVGIILFVVLVAAGSFLHLSKLNEEIESGARKEQKLKDDFLDKKKQAVNLDLYKVQLEEITKASDALLKQLPNKSEVEKLLYDINQAGVSKGLTVTGFKPDPEKQFDFYAELPIKIKVEGTYEAVGQFASELGQLSRVVILSDLKLTPNATNPLQLSMEATAKTFRYLDQEELEAQRAKREAEKKPARGKAAAKPAAKPATPAK